jgi:two-component system response regulator YesN
MVSLLRVLVADDEILARSGIKSLLSWEKYGFQIIGEAENGKKQ